VVNYTYFVVPGHPAANPCPFPSAVLAETGTFFDFVGGKGCSGDGQYYFGENSYYPLFNGR